MVFTTITIVLSRNTQFTKPNLHTGQTEVLPLPPHQLLVTTNVCL